MKKLLLLLLCVPLIGFGQELDYETLLKKHIINVWIEPSSVTEEGYIIENTVNELSLYDADSHFLQTYDFPIDRIIPPNRFRNSFHLFNLLAYLTPFREVQRQI